MAADDSSGGRTFETSSDGKTFVGVINLLHHSDKIRSTTTQIGPMKYSTVTEIFSGGVWGKTTGFDNCARS